MERWRIVKDYPNYMVSDLGNVKNIITGRILKPGLSGAYLSIKLFNSKRQKRIRIHQLVAIVFLNHVPNGHDIVVDHINNDRLDNRLVNLQLITSRENSSKDKNTSLPTGVQRRSNGKYRARIGWVSERIHLGTFNTIEEAANAYQEALKKGL